MSAGRPVSGVDAGNVPRLGLVRDGEADVEQGKKFLMPSDSCSDLRLYPYALLYTAGLEV